MNKSAVISRHDETSDNSGVEFDYQAHFAQFLDEARKNVCPSGTVNPANPEPTGKSKKKSWKTSLFSWLNKSHWKSRSTKQEMNVASVPQAGPRHVSGPIQGLRNANLRTSRGRAASSGPLLSLFSSRSAGEHEGPYMCLARVNSGNNPQKSESYGPVYLVK